MIYVIGPKDPRRKDAINTTSCSKNWSRELSPFFLGPVELYDGYIAQNVENGWQYSKVYAEHVDKNQNVTDNYWNWAKNGWSDTFAHRYPMGKGRKPLFSYWENQKLDYIEARKKIYIPLYSKAVKKTEAFAKLIKMASEGDIYLWDFDGYNHRKLDMSFDDVLNCPHRKMGHAFVLCAMLETEIK